MYKESFKNLVKYAFENSKNIKTNKTNPYYIGFGNPNSDVLILGQEKAISEDNSEQILAESIDNPIQWNKIIENNISDINYRFYDDLSFKNPLHPYSGKPKNGNTWNYYQKLLKLIYPNLEDTINSFLLKSFISEINHQVSKRQLGKQNDIKRDTVNNHPYFKEFKVVILAFGKYLDKEDIEKTLNVKYKEDLSKPYQRFVIFQSNDKKRIVINTRQLSSGVLDEYLEKIADLAKRYI